MKKKLIVAGVAAALSTAAVVPAFALENEFHGMYKLKYFLSNVDGTNSYYIAPKASATASNYFEQRARIFYTAKANDDLKLVTAFEIDSVFGDKAQGSIVPSSTLSGTTVTNSNSAAFRNSGAALESDAVNLETKWVYLDFNIPSTPVNIKAGVQAYKDPLKGILFDADAAGIYARAKYGAATTGVGYFRGYEGLKGGQSTPRGTDNLDIAVLEGTYAINKDLNIGGAYLLYTDYRTNLPYTFHTFGVTADAKIGPATISGFAAYQAGFNKNSVSAGTNNVTNGSTLDATKGTTISAWAANIAGKIKVGPGTAKTAFLITSGDQDQDGVDHSWQSVQTRVDNPTATNGYALSDYVESGLMLLNRNPATGGTTTDSTIQHSTNNKGQGMTLITAGYDATITPKLYASANVGVGLTTENNAGVAHVDSATGSNNASHYQGTEINFETGYKLYDNLTASFQAAYVFLGNYYKNTTNGQDPVNPYTTRIALTYAF